MRGPTSAAGRSWHPGRAVGVLLAVVLLAPAGCAGADAHPPREAAMTVHEGVSPDLLTSLVGNGLRLRGEGSFGLADAAVVTEPDGGQAVRARYPADSASHAAGGPEGGLQAYFTLPGGPVDALELQYRVRFPAGFDFVKGGKLPGLYGGTVNNGQHIPDGSDGLSTRYMWRTGGAGEVYAYLPTSVEHGTSLGRGCWTFPTGRWTTIRQRVVLNTPGRPDGRVQVWQDGKPVFQATGLTFRTTPQLRIDGLFLSTFFGGDSDDYRTPRDQYADFGGFQIGPAGGEPPAGTFPACQGHR